MKTKTAYWISGQKDGQFWSQYLLPNELHLIKTFLNDGIRITGIKKDVLTEKEFHTIFG